MLFTPRNTDTANASKNNSDSFFKERVQTKLAIGQPGDKYEVEADRTADSVVSKLKDPKSAAAEKPGFFAPKPVVQPKKQEHIQQKEEAGQEQEEIQEKPLSESITPLVQTSLMGEENPVQEKCDDCGPAESTPVQTKCADCEAKEKEAAMTGEQPVQQKCDKCEEQAIVQQKAAVELPELPKAKKEKEEQAPKGEKPGKEGKEGAAPAEKKAPKATGDQIDLPIPAMEKPKEAEEAPVQAKAEGKTAPSSDISGQLNASKGKGSAMDNSTQEQMGQGFGSDFSGVRIHTDSQAVQMNKELGSHAFTSGSDIYFNQGKYNPGSKEGQHLLAHELTHTVQQGAASNTVQRYVPVEKTVTPEPTPEKPNDGEVVEGKANSKVDNDENVQNQGDLSEDEKKEKKHPPRDEVRAEKGEVQAEGITTPPVNRPANAQVKIAGQKQQMNQQLTAQPPAGKGKAEKKDAKPQKKEVTAGTAKQLAKQAEQKAKAVAIPETPQPFKQPNVVAPVDSKGEALPRKANIDPQVRGLGEIRQMLSTKGYELKQHAAEKNIHSHGLDAVLAKQQEDLANARQGTTQIEDHNTGRKEVAETSKKVLQDSKERQAFVAQSAPGLAGEADGGKADSGGLASEASSKANQSKGEIPEDEDARADAEKQSAEMDQTAKGAQSMDDAVNQTGERARQYIVDAQQAAKDNQQSEGTIQQTDGVIAQLDARVAQMKGLNEASNAHIQAASSGPATIRKQAQRTARTGDELIAATITMEADLNTLQDKYLADMAKLDGYETAKKKAEEEEKKASESQMTAEDMQLFTLAGMSEPEQEQHISQLAEPEKQGLLASLDKMIANTPDNGTDETEGKRQEVKLGSLVGEGPQDPRQTDIDRIDNERITSLGGVLDIADVNMNYLTAEQQRALADKLVADSITDDIKSISVLKMGEDMLKGMADPRLALQGVVDGFGKTLTGVVNLFNAEAWAKDPLGNLLQVGADISTGLAQIFSSILGVAGLVTALMVALIIFSWGTLSPICGPVIGWMGTVMTYAGWGAIISGSLSVLFNSLAYIKNLNDAGTAQTARELFGNTEQMKQNAMDGFTGAMSIVEGVGAVKMGPIMKSGQFLEGIPKSPGAFFKQTLNGVKGGMKSIAEMPAKVVQGAKKLFASGKKGLLELKDKIKGFFKGVGKMETSGTPDFESPKKIPHHADANLGSVGGKKVEAEFEIGNGHKKKVLEDGHCATCSYCKEVRSNYKTELDEPKNTHLKKDLDDIEAKLASDPENAELVKKHNDIEADLEVQRQQKVSEHNQELIKKEKEKNPDTRNKEVATTVSSDIKTNIAPEGMSPAEFRRAQDFLKNKLDELGMGDAKVVSTGSRQTGITTNPDKPNFGNPNPDVKRDLDMRIITDKPMSQAKLDRLAAEFKTEFKIELGIKQTPSQQWPYIPKFGVVEVL